MKKGILLVVIALLAVPALSQGQGRTREEQRRRDQIRLMEGVLVQAVRLGAEQVSAELERFEPTGVTMLTGVPRARGFVLDGYGVFFDVEIPDMNQSVVWSMMNVQRDRMMGDAIDSLRSVLDTMPDAPSRERARSALQQISKTVGPAAPPRGLPPPGQVSAATAAAPVDANSLYSESVKAKLVAAMLDHSLQMNLGDEEWLTVAARASDGPMPGSGLAESITIILRVKGSDLGIYHTDKNRREEILEKVKREARVF